MDTEASPAPKYAVLFRTHLWDEYVARQLERLTAMARGGDVFVLVDDTNGRVEVPRQNVFRHTQDSVLGLGLGKAGYGNLLWFNGDYPLYAFFNENRNYGYYLMTEYDVVAQVGLDGMVSRLAKDGIDFVGLTKGESVAEWPHTDTCLDAYEPDQVRKRLICFAAFSRRAVDFLFHRRLDLSRDHRNGALRRWPYCEAFIPTELARGGFKLAELSEFGATDHYDWKPAIAEADIPLLRDQAFLHPVLDARRYVAHTLKDVWPPEAFFLPGSEVGRRLRRVPVQAYGPLLLRALWTRARNTVRKRVLGQTVGIARDQAAGRPAGAGGLTRGTGSG